MSRQRAFSVRGCWWQPGPVARVIIAEVGLDMSRFPTPAHLASWARFAPGVKESARHRKGTGATGHGNRYLASVPRR